MKLDQNEKSLLFSETTVPDIFFAEYLSLIPGNALKIYMYMIFLSKYGKDIKITDLSKKLNIPIKDINENIKFLEDSKLLLKKTNGYSIIDLQEATLHNLYTPNLTMSKEKLDNNIKSKARAKVITHINNMYFQGIMGPSWYNDIDLWFEKYGFDDQVMITLFNYCYERSAMHRNYIQTVAEAWHNNKVKTWNDLEIYYQNQDNLNIIKKDIAKKLGKYSGLNQYEEAYIENWVVNFKYDMNIIEIALKRTTSKANYNFEYINNIIIDWHDRNLKTPDEVNAFLSLRKKQIQDTKNLHKTVNKASFDQRNYENLDFLYANNSSNVNDSSNKNDYLDITNPVTISADKLDLKVSN